MQHIRLARQMGETHGWELPRAFDSAEEEFRSVRTYSGLMDASFFGRLEVQGKDALDLLHRLTTNDLASMRSGEVRGTLCTTDKGRLIDCVYLARFDNALVLLVSPGQEQRIAAWLERYTILEEVRARSLTGESALLTLFGPESLRAGSLILGEELDENICAERDLDFGPTRIITVAASRWNAVHFLVQSNLAETAWDWLSRKSASAMVRRVGTDAFDLYRVTTGMPETGKELTEQFNPYDLNLLEFVSFSKGCYIGQEVISRIDTYQKSRKRLTGLLVDAAPPGGRARVAKAETEVGVVTSWTGVGTGGAFPALAVVRASDVADGDILQIRTDVGSFRAVAVGLPLTRGEV